MPGPGGVPFDQAMARRLAEEPWLAFACGRYEGLDERVYEYAAERMPVTVVSLGDYVLNGGEVAVLAMVEAVGRLLPGVVGNAESLVEESHEDGLLEYPVYTRPARWEDGDVVREVPSVLLSGDHAAIARWRHEQRLARTAARRPDLLATAATGALADLDVRVATPADVPELRVLQLACWVPEARVSGSWTIPPIDESAEDVARGLEDWTTWVVRTEVPPPDGSSRRSAAGSVPATRRCGRPAAWSPPTSRVEASDATSSPSRRPAPSTETFWINTAAVSPANQRRYKRAGYRLLRGEGSFPGTVDLTKRRP